MRARVYYIDGHDAILYNKLVIVNIFQKKIKRGKTLFYPFFNKSPFTCGNYPWNNIKWKYFFNPFAAIINRKSNPLAHKEALGQFFLFIQIICRFARNIFNYFTVMVPDL